jgi:hypothetical protein
MVKVPDGVVDWVDTVRVEAAILPEDSVTLGGLTETEGPAGDELAERFTVPVKPLKLATVIVEVVDEPGVVVREEGLAETAKSAD